MPSDDLDQMGPIDYLVVEFPGSRMTGEGLPLDQQAYEQQAYQQQAYAEPEPAPAPADDMDAKLAQLKQLGELKTQGVLSEAEFEAQKARILGS